MSKLHRAVCTVLLLSSSSLLLCNSVGFMYSLWYYRNLWTRAAFFVVVGAHFLTCLCCLIGAPFLCTVCMSNAASYELTSVKARQILIPGSKKPGTWGFIEYREWSREMPRKGRQNEKEMAPSSMRITELRMFIMPIPPIVISQNHGLLLDR